ncbi:FAD-dependent 5-carboxymethylaminomethyl-2-thiouridine(34) oxidoreductase MnmC [Alkanindiges sp. WGS2144]|uniref:FAD-dependent 5-carboxymethylaminomethyl-2-thiouridine(34) oxidoreductase MnmC n=1 Tax=Alkanindiges sp. WGS2144 TaxID=3366808 RepID=UPI003750DCE8
MSIQPISNAQLDWLEQDGVEIPVSRQFGDVYFSRANGLAETRHVFLQGNDLTERLAQLRPYQYFCVGETGFGTGLNILALWQLWQQYRPDNHSRLHVISTEKFPLSLADLSRALKAWPELTELSAQLIAQYPPALAGCHRLVFANERFSIDLWLGDAAESLPQIQTYHAVDAWFLDGFAPKCNPDFWQDNILAHIIRLSVPGTTFASFSVAGVVKQGLRAHGMTISRPPGFGKKREMLKARWPELDKPSTTIQKPPQIAIIGAGIAGLSVAHALASRGYACQLIDKVAPLAGASGNPRALLAPKLVALHKFPHSLMNLGVLYTQRYWQQYADVIDKTQTLHLANKKTEETLQQARAYPDEFLSILNIEHTSALLNDSATVPGILFKQTALLNPQALASHVLASPLVEFIQADVQALKPITLDDGKPQWQLLNAQQQVMTTADQVVVCTALDSPLLCTPLPTLKPIRGQLSWFNQDHHPEQNQPLNQALSYGGYMAQIKAKHITLLGASFIRDDSATDIRSKDHHHNFNLLNSMAPALAAALPAMEHWQGRASIRAQSPDYLPLVGQVPGMPNIWTLCGLGSKGFSFAPLCAEMICAQIFNEVFPLPAAVMTAIKPKRFVKKKKPD